MVIAFILSSHLSCRAPRDRPSFLALATKRTIVNWLKLPLTSLGSVNFIWCDNIIAPFSSAPNPPIHFFYACMKHLKVYYDIITMFVRRLCITCLGCSTFTLWIKLLMCSARTLPVVNSGWQAHDLFFINPTACEGISEN